MLWLAFGPSRAMESQVLVIRIKIPNRGAVDWTVNSGPQLLFRDVLVSVHVGVQAPARGRPALRRSQHLTPDSCLALACCGAALWLRPQH